MKDYDYIIAGSGCAGLSLAVHMINSGKFSGKQILIADKEQKAKNDRTWCFWETGTGIFEPIVHKSWESIRYCDPESETLLIISPYRYKLIRGIDFYNYCLELIGKHPNFKIIQADINSVGSDETIGWIDASHQRIKADYVFNSIQFEKPVLASDEYLVLQHFKGWFIETKTPAFDTSAATLMDFRTSQLNGAAFVYTMPFTSTTALVEYTLFSKKLLADENYDAGLKNYLIDRGIVDYSISEKEFGVIPMTNHRFKGQEGRVINIGTAGGQTKASTGYTFRFIQKHSEFIVNRLIAGDSGLEFPKNGKYSFYDKLLLKILHESEFPLQKIFSALFRKNPIQKVFKFLDNETSIPEEIKIIFTLPTQPFLKAVFT
jgi:lycopene beta-cyclase